MKTFLVRSLARLAAVLSLTFALVAGVGAVAQAKPGLSSLGLGNVGNGVRCVQSAFDNLADAGLRIDGIFGERTRAATINWQNFFGLNPDGIVGPVTGESIKNIWDYVYSPGSWSRYHIPSGEVGGGMIRCYDWVPSQT